MDTTTFESLGLEPAILEALKHKGFEEPTPIQVLAIPRLLSGSINLVARARTGTGKTAAFGLPLIQKLNQSTGKVRALVLVPTRELALQVTEEISSLRPSGEFPRIAPVYGGASYGEQFRRLSRGVEIIVGTPGRVKDHIDRKSLDLSALEYFVLDEADEMLDMGFSEDIDWIFEQAPVDRRVLMFSATMPKEILRIAKKRLGEYEIVADESGPVETNLTDQIWIEVREADKLEVLCRIIDVQEEFYGIVFCATKVDADNLARSLGERGYGAEALHGDLSQTERERVLGRFRSKRTTILAATDVAARGIDIDKLTHVVNFALPHDPDSYTHRIGRTGRAGNTGTAVTLVTPDEYRRIFFLQKNSGGALKKASVPQVDDVLDAKRSRIRSKVLSSAVDLGLVSDTEEGTSTEAKGESTVALERWRRLASELLETLSPEDALAAALSAGYGPELDPNKYREIKTGLVDSLSRIFIGFGRRDGADRRAVADFVKDLAGIPDRLIEGVEVYDAFSFVNVPFESAEKIIAEARKSGKGPVVKLAFPKDGGRAHQGRPFHKGPPRGNSGRYVREGYHPAGRSHSPHSNSRTA
jgi:ATP-dependent RNA helicase DeaD